MTPPAQPGDAMPDFRGPTSKGQTLSLDSFLNKVPLVLVFLPNLEDEDGLDLLDQLDAAHASFGSERSQVLVVAKATSGRVRGLAEERNLTVPLLADADGSAMRAYGLDLGDPGSRPVVVVGDAGGSVVRRFDPLPLEGAVDALLSLVRGMGTGNVIPGSD